MPAAQVAQADQARPAAEERLPRPAELERDVQFWIRVYSEVTTSEGLLHDDRNLGIVYRKLKFRPEVTPRERRDAVDAERKKIQAMLRRLASGATDLTEDERAVAAVFGKEASPARFAEAVDAVRFQLGQADRFRAGLERSGVWEAHIADTFAGMGLPPELAVLPHVESSFDPTAYSKVGAAGLWQFMPGTGRRFLHINDAVDERMDPFRATEAAAQLLDFNYRLLGSWPLALTAYNHGAAGMRRARDTLGTTDITAIVRRYKSPSFGFASRNFYVSFLAALEIDRNPQKYFGNITRRPPMRFTEVEMPAYVPLAALQRTLKVDRRELLDLNPALRAPVADGQRFVPKGYRLRLPAEAASWTGAMLASSLAPAEQYLGQPRARSMKVGSGDTLSKIAQREGVTVAELARLNNLDPGAALHKGRTLQLPERMPDLVAAAEAEAEAEAAASEPAAVEARVAKAPEPVTVAEAQAASPALAPDDGIPQTSDPLDYGVAANGTVRVAATETLGHFADWLGIAASRLRTLNNLRAARPLSFGQVLKLDFTKVARAEFEQRRRAYHQALQAEFFAAHRITGTEVYVTRRGDSLWQVMQRHGDVPSWLLLQYNPDVDFAALRAGLAVVIPKVEVLSPT
ncbi:MAG: transglycosylase SLT domain-containing protein [Steroidobacteraceae bacterium]